MGNSRLLFVRGRRLDEYSEKTRQRRETVEHPLRHTEDEDGGDSLSDEDAAPGRLRDGTSRIAYNLTRVTNIMGIQPLTAAIRA
jgi:hypothetical protein